MASIVTNRPGVQGVGQSFYINDQSGAYITSIDVFFAAKHSTLPVFLELRPMKNGVPSSEEIIPGSIVKKSAGSITTSTDGQTATNFEFTEPVFLSQFTEYAFIIYSAAKEYKVYIAKLGEFELNSTAKRIKTQPYVGSVFLSQNLSTWTADQNTDIKFEMYRANFLINNTTVAQFYNNAVPKKMLTTDPFTTDSGSSTVTVNHPNHGFQVGDIVTLSSIDSGADINGISGVSVLGDRTITGIDYTGYTFAADSSATSNGVSGGSGVLATQNYIFDIFTSNVETLVPNDCGVGLTARFTSAKSFAGSETAYQKGTTLASFENILNYTGLLGENPYVVANRDIEATELGANVRSLDVRATFNSQNSFVSPYVDMQRTAFLLQGNIIDNQDSSATSGYNVPLNFVNETDPLYGSAASKYISKTITLEETAVGLKVFLGANRPPSADFHLYYKTGTSDTNLDAVNWVLATKDHQVPADDDLTKFREYQYTIGGEGGNLPAFTKFKMKIVMTSTNSARPPVFRDFRAIALSV